MKHYIKTIKPHFENVWSGAKTFEIRVNDRNYQVGDTCVLMEYDKEADLLVGREIEVYITHIITEYELIYMGVCVFSFVKLKQYVK